MKKLSVITVCYNAASLLERTLLSVLSQKGADFEYLVIDGGSTDGTLDLLQKYSRKIDLMVSEPDNGIYNAMNKAVKSASGEYCIFMNAGDCFCKDSTLAEVTPYLDGNSVIVLGNELLMKGRRLIGYTKSSGAVSDVRLKLSSISHQASFILRSSLLDSPYDESLRLVSDWKFALDTILIKGLPYSCIDVDVCRFYVGGATFQQSAKGREERHDTLLAFFGPEETAQIEKLTLKTSLTSRLRYHIVLALRSFIFFVTGK